MWPLPNAELFPQQISLKNRIIRLKVMNIFRTIFYILSSYFPKLLYHLKSNKAWQKKHGLAVTEARGKTLQVTSCVSTGRLLNFSELQLPYLETRDKVS